MALIASINGATREVFLDASTMNTTILPIDIYKEMRSLRRLDETLRNWFLFIGASGNVPKSAGKFTERITTLLLGTRIIPFDSGTVYDLTVAGTLISDDGQEGIPLFDKSSLSPATNVNINYVPPQVEVITIAGGTGLDAAQDAKLTRIFSLLDDIESGLDHAQIMRIILSASSGKVIDAETGVIKFRDNADTKNRIVAVTDGQGNRTSVTLDAS